MAIADLVDQASPEARAVAEAVLRDDIENRRWAAQVGACLSRPAVASLLGKSPQAVAKDDRLFVFRNGDGRPVYPTFQFDGRTVLDGLPEIVQVLAAADDDLTVLAWLTAPKPGYGGSTPVELLRAGRIDEVRSLAADFAAG